MVEVHKKRHALPGFGADELRSAPQVPYEPRNFARQFALRTSASSSASDSNFRED
jgi:hypothetical protein